MNTEEILFELINYYVSVLIKGVRLLGWFFFITYKNIIKLIKFVG